jgi:hypothetical protein
LLLDLQVVNKIMLVIFIRALNFFPEDAFQGTVLTKQLKKL